MTNRRGFLTGLLTTAVCAPAIIRTPGLLMPIKPTLIYPEYGISPAQEALRILAQFQNVYAEELAHWRRDIQGYGTGYLKISKDGMKHIPIDEVEEFP